MSVIEKVKVNEQEKAILLAKAVKEGLILAVDKVRGNNRLSSLFHFTEVADTYITETLEERFRGINNIRVISASTDTIVAGAIVQVELDNTLYDINVIINFSASGITYATIKTYKLVNSSTERV